MARLFKWLVISRSKSNVRSGVPGILSNLLILAGVVFTLEVALIVFGMSDVFLPISRAAKSFLSGLVF